MHVSVIPELIIWARKRAGLGQDDLSEEFKDLADWERGSKSPTLKQLEDFARAVNVPSGFLFLNNPPVESIPIEDFRTIRCSVFSQPSPILLETIYSCQSRQDWYREYALNEEFPSLEFIGSVDESSDPVKVAAAIRSQLDLEPVSDLKDCQAEETMWYLIDKAEDAGILVMIGKIAGRRTRRSVSVIPFDPYSTLRMSDELEFRGFALSDDLAPIIFINSADSTAAQIFTLANELAHLWLGRSALSNARLYIPKSHNSVEKWCNKVAAELLVSTKIMETHYQKQEKFRQEIEPLMRTRNFIGAKVNFFNRMDHGWINGKIFRSAQDQGIEKLTDAKRCKASGVDYYHSTESGVSKKFAYALIVSTYEGQTLYRDACHLLGVANIKSLDRIGRMVGIEN